MGYSPWGLKESDTTERLQGILSTQGSNTGLLHWQADSLQSEPSGKPSKPLDILI